MERFRNFYETLGITRTATDMEVAQAYRAQLQKLQASVDAEATATMPERLKLLEEAYRTLTNPAGRKKHDEAVAWQATKRELEAEEARRLAAKRKEEKERAEQLAKAAREAEQAEAMTAELKAFADTKLLGESEPSAKPTTGKAPSAGNKPKRSQADFVDTVPQEDLEEDELAVAAAPQHSPSKGKVTQVALGGTLVLVLSLLAYWGLRRAPPPPPAQPVAVAPTMAVPASAPMVSASEAAPPVAAASSPAPAAAAASKINTAKAEEAKQYQKVLQRVEQEHPELNPRHPQRRDDLIAYVATRVNAHMREGYAKAKALEIAVRDLETQEQTRRLIESVKAEKPKPVAEPAPKVLDAGGHVGFDPKCRWVTAEQWSCK